MCKNKTSNKNGYCGQCLGATTNAAPQLPPIENWYSEHCEWCAKDLPHADALGRDNGRHLCEACAVQCALCHKWVANDDSEMGPNDEFNPQYPVCNPCLTKMDVDERGDDALDRWLGEDGKWVIGHEPFDNGASDWRFDEEEVDEAMRELDTSERPSSVDELNAMAEELSELADSRRRQAWGTQAEAMALIESVKKEDDAIVELLNSDDLEHLNGIAAWSGARAVSRDAAVARIRAIDFFEQADGLRRSGERLEELSRAVRVRQEQEYEDDYRLFHDERTFALEVAADWDARRGGFIVSEDGDLLYSVKDAIEKAELGDKWAVTFTDNKVELEAGRDGGPDQTWHRLRILGEEDAEDVLYNCRGSVNDLLRVDAATKRLSRETNHRLDSVYEALEGDWNGGYAEAFTGYTRAALRLNDSEWDFFLHHAKSVGTPNSGWKSYDELIESAKDAIRSS